MSTVSLTPEPIFFWKPDEENGWLGQWYPSPFTVKAPDGTENGPETGYVNCEQYEPHLTLPFSFHPVHKVPKPCVE